MLGLPLLVLLSLEAPPSVQASAERPALGFALSFGFEPRFGNFQALDEQLEAYGFAPVARPYLLTYGLRGRFYTPRGMIFGGTMSYAFARADAPGNPVPTTTNRIEIQARVGHQLGRGFEASCNLGFAVHSHSVGSPVQGGALVYMGPQLQPQVGYTLPVKPNFLHLSLGYSALFPIGAAHQQVLWEADFDRPVVHSFTFGIESGFSFNRPRLRWRERRGS